VLGLSLFGTIRVAGADIDTQRIETLPQRIPVDQRARSAANGCRLGSGGNL